MKSKRLRPGWGSLILVCKSCAKRTNGPKKASPRALAKGLRRAALAAGIVRPRAVLTSCLGACPKKAFTVAVGSNGADWQVVAVRGHDDLSAAAAAFWP